MNLGLVNLKKMVKTDGISGMSPQEDPTVKTSVTIRRSQLERVKRNHVNVSGVLQEALDKMMEKVKFA